MDGWRNAGRLFWCPLKKDTAYRRVENPIPRGAVIAFLERKTQPDSIKRTTWHRR
jgi:hypothetical protein